MSIGVYGVRLQQSQLAGTCDRFSAALDLEFAKDLAVVPFNGIQGEEESLGNFTIGESLGKQLQHF